MKNVHFLHEYHNLKRKKKSNLSSYYFDSKKKIP